MDIAIIRRSKTCSYTAYMEGSWLDNIPSTEKRKLRKMMSPEAYERLREKVKGPADLEKELKRGEQLAELSFELQTDEKLRERLKTQCEKDIQEEGIEALVETEHLSPEAKKAMEQGKFMLAVASHPSTHDDQLVAVPEGNVQEKIPLQTSVSDRYVAQFVTQRSAPLRGRDDSPQPRRAAA